MASPNNQLFLIVQELIRKLFETEERHLTRREMDMVPRNMAFGGTSDGYRYAGRIYTPLNVGVRKLGSYKPIHSSLIPEMNDIVQERRFMEQDREKIRQGLSLVLRGCKTAQDMRDALPNGVAPLVPGIEKLHRTRPEAFTLADNPKMYNQYMELRDRIDYYVASKLLY